MKLGHLITFTILIVISAAFAKNFKNENSPRWFKFKPKTEPLMKTFSLSVVGDFSFSRITNFLMKIFEGITELFDLKAVRKAVDYGFDMFRPRNDVYDVLHAQSRNDIFDIKIEEIENPEMADQLEKAKEEINFRKSITVAIGGIMQKQQCWQQASCYTGVYARKIPGVELGLMMIEKWSRNTTLEAPVDVIIQAAREDDKFECNYKCDDTKDCRDGGC